LMERRTPAPHRFNKNNEIWFRTGRLRNLRMPAVLSLKGNQDTLG
jgi:hypothetical protein